MAPRLVGALILLAGFAPAAWAGAVLGEIRRRNIGFAPEEKFTEQGIRLGELAAARTLELLPALALIALLAAMMGRRRRVVLVGAGCLACGLGYFSPLVPGFFVQSPDVVVPFMHWFGGVWGRMTGVAALGLLGATYYLTVIAGRILDRTVGAARPGRGMVRLRRQTRRRLAGPLALIVFLCALWSAAVVRLTLDGVAQDVVGEYAGRLQSSYLPICVVLAGAVWLRAREPLGGAFLITAGAVGTVLAGAWPEAFDALSGFTEHPIAEGLLIGLGGIWEGATFWCALLLYLPMAVGGLLLLRESPA